MQYKMYRRSCRRKNKPTNRVVDEAKKEKATKCHARVATKEADVNERSMGNTSGTNILYYSTVRQKILLGLACAPEFSS